MKDLTLEIDFNKSPFSSKPDNSLKDYAEQIRNNKEQEYLDKSNEAGKVSSQIVGYEKF